VVWTEARDIVLPSKSDVACTFARLYAPDSDVRRYIGRVKALLARRCVYTLSAGA